MSVKKRIFWSGLKCIQFGLALAGRRKASRIAANLVQGLTPIVTIPTACGEVKFFCPGRISVWRAEALLTKEPDTIEWINGFSPDDVFWDIGANVGSYALYAAKRGIRVLGFEPSSANYYVFNKNIEINHLDRFISAFCIAFYTRSILDQFHMPVTDPGGALSAFVEKKDWQGQNFNPKFSQGMVGFSMDDFIELFNPAFPTHIKIDVDGIEDRIIIGAEKTLADPRLKSVLIELNTEDQAYFKKVVSLLAEAGLVLSDQMKASLSAGSRFTGVYNHIFKRV